MSDTIREEFAKRSGGSINLEKVFSLMENSEGVSDVVNTLMNFIGNYYELDAVVVLEFDDNGTVRCSYEWNKDGMYKMLNVEKRFLQKFDKKWLDNYNNPDGVWLFENSKDIIDVRDKVSMARYDILGTMLEVPMYRNEHIMGCIDFISSKRLAGMFSDSKRDMKAFARVMSSYLIPMRELDDNVRKIDEISEYDAISHLPKYEFFKSNVLKFLERIPDSKVEIISMDLSNFKYLNEKYGHIAGDHILRSIASRIYTISGNIISCCRPFSDYFIIAVRASETMNFATIREAVDVAARELTEDLREQYFDTNIIMNAGVAVIKPGDNNLEAAVTNSNIARKFAKMGKAISNCRIMQYSPNMSLAENRQSELLASMNKAIIDEDFFIMLQPICVTDLSSVVGAEALVRWRKDESHVLLPGDFLSTFEKVGYIIKLDYFVIDKVFSYLRKRLDEGKPIVPISVNVSYVHFQSTEIIDYIKKLRDKYDIDPYYIEFDLSEQVYISDNSNVSVIIDAIKKMGYKIFIDDFGSGYSSLNTLTKYPIDGIKLDRSFMKSRLDRTDEIIIQCIVNMANKLNLQIIAEGVETEEQRIFLLENECPYLQGHLYSAALSVEQFSYLIDNQ